MLAMSEDEGERYTDAIVNDGYLPWGGLDV
jgi:hypothetical protein